MNVLEEKEFLAQLKKEGGGGDADQEKERGFLILCLNKLRLACVTP